MGVICGAIRAFPSTLLKNLSFTISKLNFITYNTPLYKISYIKNSIFFNTSFKYSFFIIFYSSSLFLCLFLLCVSLSQPSTAGHHIHPKKKNHLHIQSHKIKESSKSKNHKITTKTQNHPDQPTPSTQSHPNQLTNLAIEIKNPPKSIKTTEIKTHRYQIAKPTHRTTTETHHEPP